jgi:hypothetical protein
MSITATPSAANAGNAAINVAINNGTNNNFFIFNPLNGCYILYQLK